MTKWKKVDKDLCELEGPYECEECRGHIMLDATFLDQVGMLCTCPYCDKLLRVTEDEIPESKTEWSKTPLWGGARRRIDINKAEPNP